MRFQCPICKELLLVEDSEMGASVQCVHCGKEVKVPSSRTAPGSVIGDFIIQHELGRGGMGIVYAAHQISLDRPAALKILAESFARNTDFVVGFIKEARAAAKLNHPNIVQAYAVGDDNGVFYFAMEHINGETMKSILDREKVIPVEKAIDIVRQIAEALEYAWQEEKLVHRDIKPDNIMLTSNGRAKLADLGLAKVGNDPSKTDGEEVMGTPQYISPEQLTGEELDNRTDIYCLGATFYQFLTGRFPYEGATALEIARQHLEGTLIPPNKVNPAIPEAVSHVVEKMMAKNPDDRYQSAGQLAEDLNLIKRGHKPLSVGGVSKLSPPKIKIPGKKTPEAGAASVKVPQKAGGKTTSQNGPKLSLKNHASTPEEAIPQFTAAPKDAKKTAAPENAASADGNAGKAEEKKTKPPLSAGKKIALIAGGVVILSVLGCGGWAAYLQFVKKQNPLNFFNTVITDTKERIHKATAEPEPSEFMKAATPLVGLIRKPDAATPETCLQCYEFLKKQLLPQTEDEKEMSVEILDFFARNDEGQVESAREKALEAYEEKQKQERLAKEEADKKKMEAERIARRRAEERKLAEAERKRKEAEKAEEEGKKKRQLNALKYKISSRDRQIRVTLFRCGQKNDKEQIMQLLMKNLDYGTLRDEFPRPEWMPLQEYNRYIGSLLYTARSTKTNLEKAWEWDKIFNEGHPGLVGMTIELHRNICRITALKDGVIHAKAGSKEFAEPVRKLVDNKKFLLFSIKAGNELKKKDSMPYYFFWIGGYRLASQIAQELPNKEKWRYNSFVNAFLKEIVKDPQVKPELEKYFRGVPEYDRMFPPRRNGPPPRKNTRKKKK